MAIQKVAVIGAGVMGSGIAAHLANAGMEVELLDIVPNGADDRDVIAKSAIAKMAKDKMLPLMHKDNAKRIRPGNLIDNLDRLNDCDFIVEAVLEDPEIKTSTFKTIDEHRKKGSIVASNTSTIPLEDLVAGQSPEFKRDFFITHFFNPPRHMRLLELVTSEHNSADKIKEITEFMDITLGKGVIVCKDKPGFIGNRLGVFWIQTAINEAYKFKLRVEEVDALMGRPVGIPKIGVFALLDLIGLDLMPHISKSLLNKLPKTDAYHKVHKTYPVITQMIEDGFTGRKTKGGFYRRTEAKKDIAVDLDTGETRPKNKPKKLAAIKRSKKGGIRALVNGNDVHGQFVWEVLKQLLCYAGEHAHDITNNICSVDQAMRLGYGWQWGPFELLDKIGVDYFIERCEKEGFAVPAFIQLAKGKTFYRVEAGKVQYLNQAGEYTDIQRPEGVLLLSDIKRASKPVLARSGLAKKLGMGADVWDIGDGVLCIEFKSKMNSLDFFNLKTIANTCKLAEGSNGKWKAIIIHNEGENFSVGANIGVALIAAKLKQYWVVDKMVRMGQEALLNMRRSKIPVISAPSGRALGGGCEVLLHSNYVQAHAETYPGLVEVGVGLLPGWGGTADLLTRATELQQQGKVAGGPMPPVVKAFEIISTAKVGLSAFEARDYMYFRESDGITMNKDRLLADAKKKALEMAETFTPPEELEIEMAGEAGLAALRMAVDGFYMRQLATPYDVVVSDKVAEVLTGGARAENRGAFNQEELRQLEFENFMQLTRESRTLARISTILKTGKPLREKPEPGKSARELRDEVPSVLTTSNKNNELDKRKLSVNWPDIKALTN